MCPDHSVCNNTIGSFLCLCFEGFHKAQDECLGNDENIVVSTCRRLLPSFVYLVFIVKIMR